jgi:PAS domain S-box-containing protein
VSALGLPVTHTIVDSTKIAGPSKASALLGAGWENDSLEVLWEDSERVFCRFRRGSDDVRYAFTSVRAAAEHPTSETIARLSHEYEIKDYLDGAWAVRPVELLRKSGRTMLIVEYAGGEPLDHLTGQPMEMELFLPLAVAIAAAIRQLHARGLIHKDVKPANVLVESATGRVWLMGFGIASRLPRERQRPEPPEVLAGTLAYMAPEQTGRVNRSIDTRSDLYSLGVTFYEMLTGSLPFAAFDAMEWVHCHVARQPVLPSMRLKSIPPSVCAITMKLLSKTVEARYQTAAGVENDLRRCLHEWQAEGCIHDLALGARDTPDRLMIPEKLYGRDRELEMLLAAFDRTVAGGGPELMLVSGYSGIGKSAVVNELHKALVPTRGLFASGKFDQYKRDIPYATLAQAFESLVRALLSKNEEELQNWRAALREALDPNGLLIVDLVPKLKHVIGEQPPVPELPPQEAQRRFHLVFRRFIGVFARADHPLALFLDDLQWLDAATLDLLEDLLTGNDLQHLLLIGAYRDNEVSATHPLVRKLEAMRRAGATMHDIVLRPLRCDDLRRLLMDTLHCEPEPVAPLAELIHQKTTGNPFFAIQFISTLAEEGLLTFDYGEGYWLWDLQRIHAQGYTDNVVELMVEKLNRLPHATQRAVQRFACMGNSAAVDVLSMAFQDSTEELHDHLWEAVRAGLIFRSDNGYRFLHDRVQEAAYSLIPEQLRAEAHLHIGTLLAAHTPPERLEESIFEIVNQLNRGSHLITAGDERERVADLNLTAGRRAKISTAYASALKYLRAAKTLLSETTWESNYQLIFAIELLISECEMLTADKDVAESRLAVLAQRAKNRHDYSVVTRLRLALYTTMDRGDRVIDVFLEYLRCEGTVWSPHPTRDDVLREYERIWTLLGSRQIEELVDLPVITDPDTLDTLDVFTEVVSGAAQHYDEHFFSLVVCRLVTLLLENGNCDAACFGYVWFATIAGPRFDNYKDGSRFGQLGYDLVELRGLKRYQARTYMSMGALVTPWTHHVASGRELVRRAFDDAYRVGDLTFAAYSWNTLISICLAVGDRLEEVQTQAESGLAFAKRMHFGVVVDLCGTQLALTRTLRGLTTVFGSLNDADFDELKSERRRASNPDFKLAEFFYYTRKLQGRFFAGDFEAAVGASLKAHQLLWTSPSQLETAEFRFYGALAHAACWTSASADQRPQHFEVLTDHHRQLEVWAEHCPATFENRALLVAAEIARIEGRLIDAEELYERATRSAHAHGFVQNEALAHELAAQFYAARGLERFANTCLRDARHCYLRWGADGKVSQLERQHPHLRADKPIADSTTTISTPVDHLDLSTVIKVSEALSGEIVLDKLIETLIRTAIENAGAERGLLILSRGDELWVVAEAVAGSNKVHVELRQCSVAESQLPQPVLRYALRTKEPVLLQDASGQGAFAADSYVRQHHARSVLCLPILKQARLLGMLYLENNLSAHVFTPARMTFLKLLASEAAVSIENAKLYRDLAEREARIRRLVDANIIGIMIWDLEGRVLEANDAFLRMVGYDRADLASKVVRWTDLTPPEWRDRDEHHWIPALKATGTLQPYEKEFFRKDGSRVPVLIGVAAFEEGGNQGVGFVIDLTERKSAVDALRTLQMELAHANRLATMGQLSASIAHEVNQPIGAARNNAHAALRFLSRDPPDLGEVREALECVVNDTYRASDIIGGIRDQVKKVPPRMESVDLNDAMLEVIGLIRSELSKHRVSVQTKLTGNLPPARADRVQLQQIILNLILNATEAMATTDYESRELVISTSSNEVGSLLVAIADSGPGIAAENRTRIFDSFYTTKTDGVGIGLSICRFIIDAHGGQLWAEAHEPRGAMLKFTLPVHS